MQALPAVAGMQAILGALGSPSPAMVEALADAPHLIAQAQAAVQAMQVRAGMD